MYNPYLHDIGRFLTPVREKGAAGLLGGILQRIRTLDEDDILLLLILFFLMKNGDREGHWPLLVAIAYCIL